MSDRIHLQKQEKYNQEDWNKTKAPVWHPIANHQDGTPHKPIVRCDCGQWVGLQAHSIEPSGEVNASFLHKPNGCGWHVFITLDGWDGGKREAGKP